MHAVEAAWRHFRNSGYHALLEQSLEDRQPYLDCLGLKRCPAEVVLPLAVPWNLAGNGLMHIESYQVIPAKMPLPQMPFRTSTIRSRSAPPVKSTT
jgi:hypothetical protein